METRSQAKAKLMKRQRDDAECGQRKSQRLESTTEPACTTKIVDLNDDCLTKIFGYLNLRSLFSVAVANEWLRPAAQEVYKRKFGKNLVIINDCDEIYPNADGIDRFGQGIVTSAGAGTGCKAPASKYRDEIYLIGLKASLQYLRCFGSSIIDLRVNYNASESKRYDHVLQYINDYCANSLTRIQFDFMPNIAVQQFQKVFTRIEIVEIRNGVLEQQWPTFLECFPNLRRLIIEDVDIKNSVIAKSFGILEQLCIHNIECNGRTTCRFVTALLHGANRLKFLWVNSANGNVPIDELLAMIKDSPAIIGFGYSLRETGCIPVTSEDIQRIASEHPALIELQLPDYRFTAGDAVALIRQHNSLNGFGFQMKFPEYRNLVAQLYGGQWEVRAGDEDIHLGYRDIHLSVTLNRLQHSAWIK